MKAEDHIEPQDLADLVSHQIRLIQIAAYKSFETQAKGFGSAPRYFGLLRIIESNPGLNQSRLAEAVCLDRSRSCRSWIADAGRAGGTAEFGDRQTVALRVHHRQGRIRSERAAPSGAGT